MRKINLFLATADRHGSNLIEAAVLDACYEQATVESRRTMRLHELLRFGASEAFQLIIVAVDCLHAEPSRRSPWVTLPEVLAAVRQVKQLSSTPLVAFDRTEENHAELLQAGADAVLLSPHDADQLKSEVRRLLRLPEPATVTQSGGLSPWAALFRGLLRRNA